ncbi:MAG: PadR family transcriptional regulator [bacterium]
MTQDNSLANFRRSAMPLIVLRLLRDGDMYGYQLVQEISSRSGGALQTLEGSLYPVLYRLEEAGFVSTKKEIVAKRMTRVYYHLEPPGEERLVALEAEYRALLGGLLRILDRN